MTTRVRNMTEGKPLPLIISFALPLMLGNVFQQLYTVVDTMVVGKRLGVAALAALGAADWLNWMMLGVIQGLTQGFAILISREFGARQYRSMKSVTGSSVILAAISSLVLLAMGQAGARPALLLLKTPADILDNTLLYLRIIYAGVPIVMAYNLFACILRALGDGKTPLNAMIVASFVNIVLDLLFVLGFDWGIAGAAAATLLAQLVSGLFCLWHIRQIDVLILRKEHFKLKWPMAKELLVLGFPVALQNAIISVGGMIVQTVVNGFGVIFIAGVTATNKLYGILEIAATSYGYSMITFVGQNVGAKKPQRIRKGVRAAVAVALLTAVAIVLVMLTCGKPILSQFISGTAEQAAQTLEIAYYYLVVMSLFLPVLYLLHMFRSTIQGLGNTVLPMVSGIGELIMRVLSAVLLPRVVGNVGIFYAEILAWMGADAVLIPSYFVTMKRLEKAWQAESDTVDSEASWNP